jgi:hypothetical protein
LTLTGIEWVFSGFPVSSLFHTQPIRVTDSANVTFNGQTLQ